MLLGLAIGLTIIVLAAAVQSIANSGTPGFAAALTVIIATTGLLAIWLAWALLFILGFR
jgi:hypothetical protein